MQIQSSVSSEYHSPSSQLTILPELQTGLPLVAPGGSCCCFGLGSCSCCSCGVVHGNA